MYCKNCGIEIDKDSNFCFNCGTKVSIAPPKKETIENDEEYNIKEEEHTEQKIEFEDELLQLEHSINDTKYVVFSFDLNTKIPEILKSIIQKKSDADLALKNYRSMFNKDLIQELNKLSNNYTHKKEYLSVFIDNKIIAETFPHDYLDDQEIVDDEVKKDEPVQKKGGILKYFLGIGAIILIFSYFFGSKSNATSDESTDDNFKSFYKFKSELVDVEKKGAILKTSSEITFHSFDFKNMRILKEVKEDDGSWTTYKFPMKSFYKEGVTYVIEVYDQGVTEVWFSPFVDNLGYDFYDGHRFAYYELEALE